MITTPTTTARCRIGLIAAVAMLSSLSLVTAATAQQSEDLDIDVTVTEQSRNLLVTATDGSPIDSLTLTPGRGQDIRVAVQDVNYDPTAPFNVLAEQGNLYPVVDGIPNADGTPIPSRGVSMSSSQLSLSGLGVAVDPLLDLVEDPAAQCSSLPLLDQAACEVVQPLVAALTGPVPIDVTGTIESVHDLTDTVDDVLQLALGSGTNPFANPSYRGIGAADSRKPATPTPTQLAVFGSTPLTTMPTDLLTGALTDLGLPTDGTVPLSADAVRSALTDSGASGAAVAAALALQPTAVQDVLIDLLFDLDLPVDALGVTGLYSAIPTLVVNPGDDVAAGAYRGTYTVTLLGN